MKIAQALALSLGLAALSAPALAAPPPPPPDDMAGDVPPPPPPPPGEEEGGMGPVGPHMLKKLGLSDDQKTKVQTIRQKYEPKFKDLMEQMRSEREAMGQVMATHPAVEQARAEHRKMQALADQMGDQRFEMMYEIAGVLTADQRAALLKDQKDMAERWRKHHGHHHDHDDHEK